MPRLSKEQIANIYNGDLSEFDLTHRLLKDNDYNSILHHLVMSKNLAAVTEGLSRLKLNVYCFNKEFNSPIDLALANKDYDIAKVLLAQPLAVDSEHLERMIKKFKTEMAKDEDINNHAITYASNLSGNNIAEIFADNDNLTVAKYISHKHLLKGTHKDKSKKDGSLEGFWPQVLLPINIFLSFELHYRVANKLIMDADLPDLRKVGVKHPKDGAAKLKAREQLSEELKQELKRQLQAYWQFRYTEKLHEIKDEAIRQPLLHSLIVGMSNSIKALNVNESLIFCAGWSEHAIYLQIKHHASHSYSILIHNLGDGNDLHKVVGKDVYPFLVGQIELSAWDEAGKAFGYLKNILTQSFAYTPPTKIWHLIYDQAQPYSGYKKDKKKAPKAGIITERKLFLEHESKIETDSLLSCPMQVIGNCVMANYEAARAMAIAESAIVTWISGQESAKISSFVPGADHPDYDSDGLDHETIITKLSKPLVESEWLTTLPAALRHHYEHNYNEIPAILSDVPLTMDQLLEVRLVRKNQAAPKALIEDDKAAEPAAGAGADNEVEAQEDVAEPVTMAELLAEGKPTLILGQAGAGKSTLMQSMAYQWSQGNVASSFQQVFLLPLRVLKSITLKGKSLEEQAVDLLARICLSLGLDDEALTTAAYSLFSEDNQKQTLWLLDGHDEVATGLKDDAAKLLKFLAGQPHVVLTSRAIYLQKLKDLGFKENHIEVMGLSDEQIEAWLCEAFLAEVEGDAKQLLEAMTSAQAFIEVLKANENLWQLIHQPIYLRLIYILQSRGSVDLSRQTMTELYSEIEKLIAGRHWERQHPERNEEAEDKEFALEDTDEEAEKSYWQPIEQLLSELAFEAFEANCIEISRTIIDPKLRKLKALDATRIWAKELTELGILNALGGAKHEVSRPMAFVHLSFQEYYAAKAIIRHMQTWPEVKFASWFSLHKYDERYKLVWGFVSGLIPTALLADRWLALWLTTLPMSKGNLTLIHPLLKELPWCETLAIRDKVSSYIATQPTLSRSVKELVAALKLTVSDTKAHGKKASKAKKKAEVNALDQLKVKLLNQHQVLENFSAKTLAKFGKEFTTVLIDKLLNKISVADHESSDKSSGNLHVLLNSLKNLISADPTLLVFIQNKLTDIKQAELGLIGLHVLRKIDSSILTQLQVQLANMVAGIKADASESAKKVKLTKAEQTFFSKALEIVTLYLSSNPEFRSFWLDLLTCDNSYLRAEAVAVIRHFSVVDEALLALLPAIIEDKSLTIDSRYSVLALVKKFALKDEATIKSLIALLEQDYVDLSNNHQSSAAKLAEKIIEKIKAMGEFIDPYYLHHERYFSYFINDTWDFSPFTADLISVLCELNIDSDIYEAYLLKVITDNNMPLGLRQHILKSINLTSSSDDKVISSLISLAKTKTIAEDSRVHATLFNDSIEKADSWLKSQSKEARHKNSRIGVVGKIMAETLISHEQAINAYKLSQDALMALDCFGIANEELVPTSINHIMSGFGFQAALNILAKNKAFHKLIHHMLINKNKKEFINIEGVRELTNSSAFKKSKFDQTDFDAALNMLKAFLISHDDPFIEYGNKFNVLLLLYSINKTMSLPQTIKSIMIGFLYKTVNNKRYGRQGSIEVFRLHSLTEGKLLLQKGILTKTNWISVYGNNNTLIFQNNTISIKDQDGKVFKLTANADQMAEIYAMLAENSDELNLIEYLYGKPNFTHTAATLLDESDSSDDDSDSGIEVAPLPDKRPRTEASPATVSSDLAKLPFKPNTSLAFTAIDKPASVTHSTVSESLADWYDDEKINSLLDYFCREQGIVPIKSLSFDSTEKLEADLIGTRLSRAFAANESAAGRTRYFLPLRINRTHWVGLWIDNQAGNPLIYWLDPFGQPPAFRSSLLEVLNATNMFDSKLTAEHIHIQAEKIQHDGVNCGPFIIEILRFMNTHNRLPSAGDIDIAKARAEHETIMKVINVLSASQSKASGIGAGAGAVNATHRAAASVFSSGGAGAGAGAGAGYSAMALDHH